MTLSFTQKWPSHMDNLAGQPNYFIEKIWLSLLSDKEYSNQIYDYEKRHVELFDEYFDTPSYGLEPKLHTIREDKHDRWKAGNDIHVVINNRTKDRFQFAPVFKCVSVQEIEIINLFNDQKIKVDRKWLSNSEIEQLAINDGFPTVDAFFNFFNNIDFTGKIIHWTYKRY